MKILMVGFTQRDFPSIKEIAARVIAIILYAYKLLLKSEFSDRMNSLEIYNLSQKYESTV